MTAATPFDLSKVMSPDLLVTPTAAGGVLQTGGEMLAVQRIRLTLTNLYVLVTEALDYGSAAICTLPDKNLILLGCEVNLTVDKGNTTNGIVAATDLDVSIGTAAASATTLATTMLNVLPKVDLDTNATSLTLQSHSLAATPVLTGILDSPTNVLYFNAVPISGITADDYLLVSGTIDLFMIDLRNVTS